MATTHQKTGGMPAETFERRARLEFDQIIKLPQGFGVNDFVAFLFRLEGHHMVDQRVVMSSDPSRGTMPRCCSGQLSVMTSRV